MIRTVKLDVTPSTQPIPTRSGAHRRERVQEGAAIVLALLVLVATLVVATTSVAGGTVPLASRTEVVDGSGADGPGRERCERSIVITIVADGATAADHVCSFGPSSLPGQSG